MARTLLNNFDFMALRKPAMVRSVVLLLASVVSLGTLKLNLRFTKAAEPLSLGTGRNRV